MIEKLKELLNNNWEEACKLVSGVALPVFVIPTYKNRKGVTIRKLAEAYPTGKFILFVYEDDLDNYQEYLDLGNVSIVPISLDTLAYRGITPKRKFIVDYLNSQNYNHAIMLDDDIEPICLRADKKNELTGEMGKFHDASLFDSLKLIRSLVETDNFGVLSLYRTAWIRFWNKPIKNEVRAANIVWLNLEKFRLHNINYDLSLKTGEDCDLTLQCWDNKLSCYTLSMCSPKFSIVSGGSNSVSATLIKWKYDWYRLFAKWQGFLDLKNYDDFDTLKYKENHHRIYKGNKEFKDEDHKKRWLYTINKVCEFDNLPII